MSLRWVIVGSILSIHGHAATTIDICKPVGSFSPFYTEANTGLVDKLIMQAFDQPGYEVVLHALPWRRCLEGVRRGTYDGASATLATEQTMAYMRFPMRDGLVDPSRALVDFDLAAVVVRGSGIAWNGQRFMGARQYRVLVLAGWGVVADLLRESGLQVDDSPKSVEQQISMLARGRAELAIGEPQVLQQRINAQNLAARLELLPMQVAHLQAYTSINLHFYREHTLAIEHAWDQQRVLRLLE